MACVCGVTRPAGAGLTHPYVPADAGCWQLFGEVQADEMTRFGYPPAHQVVVDAYMASHPGSGTDRDRREAQSLTVHLVGLCGLLERGWDSARSRAAMRGLVGQASLPVLDGFAEPPRLTVETMVGTADLADYDRRAARWAQAVWEAYGREHGTIRALLPPG